MPDVVTQTMLTAVNNALFDAMQADDQVMVLGEDVGVNGGVFRATEGLQAAFGEKRVLDTPLAENLIAGMSIGLATQGIKPVAEFQFMGFIYPAMNQIISHAARMRRRTLGRLHCPLVFRAPYSGGIHAPEHHSESTEALFAHIPGLRVVIPSTPARAYHLLRASIDEPDPVIFLEPKKIYHAQKQRFDKTSDHYGLDQAFIDREGSDITLIAWGAMLPLVHMAAAKAEQENISVEVIDLASIKPIDEATVLQSVQKTGRLVIVHEAAKTCGVGAELAALVAEKAMGHLLSPIKRICGFDTTMPYYRLEDVYIPSTDAIMQAIFDSMRHA